MSLTGYGGRLVCLCLKRRCPSRRVIAQWWAAVFYFEWLPESDLAGNAALENTPLRYFHGGTPRPILLTCGHPASNGLVYHACFLTLNLSCVWLMMPLLCEPYHRWAVNESLTRYHRHPWWFIHSFIFIHLPGKSHWPLVCTYDCCDRLSSTPLIMRHLSFPLSYFDQLKPKTKQRSCHDPDPTTNQPKLFRKRAGYVHKHTPIIETWYHPGVK